MKRVFFVLLALRLLTDFSILCARCMASLLGRTLTLSCPLALCLWILLLTVPLFLLARRLRGSLSRTCHFGLWLLVPSSLLCACIIAMLAGLGAAFLSFFSALLSLCLVFIILPRKMNPLRILSFLLCLLLCGLSLPIGAFASAFLSDEYIHTTLPSPDGSCSLQIVTDDPSDFGHYTHVQLVWPDSRLCLGPFVLEKTPLILYAGKWYEYDSMDIAWYDSQTVHINGTPYSLP